MLLAYDREYGSQDAVTFPTPIKRSGGQSRWVGRDSHSQLNPLLKRLYLAENHIPIRPWV